MSQLDSMSEQEVQVLWQALLKQEIQRAEECLDANASNLPEQDQKQALRSWWAATHELLAIFLAAHNSKVVLEPFPRVQLHRLSTLSGELAKGIVPDLIRDAASASNGRPNTHYERKDIANAIFYKQACEGGLIRDRRSTKTVSDTYGVAKRTVQRWMNDSDALCDGFAKPKTAKAIEQQMRANGKRYDKIGRGASLKS